MADRCCSWRSAVNRDQQTDPVGRRSLPGVVVDLGGTHRLAECVSPDGSVSLWLIASDEDRHGCACCDCAPHERLGRLPDLFRDRLGRCGGTTRAGTRCRRPVAVVGGRCAQHRGAS